ncbi:hypothetical protein JCM19992_35070 [Thermostilla marina]
MRQLVEHTTVSRGQVIVTGFRTLIYLEIQGQIRGPFSLADIVRWLQQGRISLDAKASIDGGTWMPLGRVLEAIQASHNVPAAPRLDQRAKPAAPQPQDNKEEKVEPLARPPRLPESPQSAEVSRRSLPDRFRFREWRAYYAVAAGCLVLILLAGIVIGVTAGKRAEVQTAQAESNKPATFETKEEVDTPAAEPGSSSESAEESYDLAEEEPAPSAPPPPEPERNEVPPEPDEPSKPKDKPTPGSEAWIAHVRRATVVVRNQRSDGSSLGSGFFVEAPDGKPVIITNYHVVQGAIALTVELYDGTTLRVDQIQRFPKTDLAFLRCTGLRAPQILELRTTKPIVGEPTYAYGAPKGLSGTLTRGVVSALRSSDELTTTIPELSGMPYDCRMWIQTDTTINHGNSGGPLLDEIARVVGVNTLGLFEAGVENTNFCVSSLDVVDRLARMQLEPFQPDLGGDVALDGVDAQVALTTLIYWGIATATVAEFLASLDDAGELPPQLFLQRVRNQAISSAALLSALEVETVDPAALEWGREVQAWLAAFADFNATVLQQGLLTQVDQLRFAALCVKLEEIGKRQDQTKRYLTRKYGVAFP